MRLPPLPDAWQDTRTALQQYAGTLTAFPRAGADPHPQWAHVAMDPVPGGFTATPTPLPNGASLGSILDIRRHRIIATAGDHSLVFDLTEGPSPSSIGQAILGLTERYGAGLDVEEARFADRSRQPYRTEHAEAFVAASDTVVEAFNRLNDGISGPINGPHLWPHGFDVATEWISTKVVDDDEVPVNAQIASGWYPSADSYIYVNPWPFEEDFTSIDLPHGATWNTEGWYGARLDVPPDGLEIDEIVALAMAVHRSTAGALGG